MITIGIVGVGHWGPNIVRSFDLTGRATIRWMCDRDVARLQRVASNYPDARTTADVEDLFADDGLDAVVVATPVAEHFALASRALEAGKHVLIEKPITETSQQARKLIEMAEAAEKTLMVGHVFEFNSTIRALKDLIVGGEIGELQYLSSTRTNLGPVRTDVNAFWDLASHDVSVFDFLLDSAAVDVTARGGAYLNERIEDAVFATFAYPAGVLAHVNVSWINPRKVRQITVVGDRKMVVWDDLDIQRPIQIFDRHVEPPEIADSFFDYKTAVVDGGVFIPNIGLNQPLRDECDHFIDCVESGRTPDCDGRAGLRVVLALEAATRSMRAASAITAVEREER